VNTADLEVLDRAVYLEAADTLVVADLHLGRAQTAAVDLPLGEGADVRGRLDTLLDAVEPATVVLAGDVLHSFDHVPTGVSKTLRNVRHRVEDAGATLVVLQGNHDTMLPTLLDAPLQSSYRATEGTLVFHGHHEPTETADRYVVGHEHPAIEIEGQRYPCVLQCADQYDGATVVVVPAFTRLAKGTLVNRLDASETNTPLLTDLRRCRPIVRLDDESLAFPPLGEFERLL
jgi:hypothetical protein